MCVLGTAAAAIFLAAVIPVQTLSWLISPL